MISIVLNLVCLVYSLTYGLPWKIFHVCYCWVKYPTRLILLFKYSACLLIFLSYTITLYKLLSIGYWSFQLLLLNGLFLLSILSIFLHIFWGSVKCLHFDKCYIFLITGPFYIIKCPSWSLVTYVDLNSIFSDNKFIFYMVYHCHTFDFYLFGSKVSLYR